MTSVRGDSRSITAGWMLVAAIAAALALAAVGTTLGATIYPVPVAVAFILAVLHAAAVPLALLAPRAAGALSITVVTILAIVQSSVVGAAWPWSVTMIVTQSIVVGLIGFQTRTRTAAVVWLASIAGTIIAAILFPKGTDAAAINLIIMSSISAVALAGGVVAREWRAIGAQLVRERALSAREHDQRVLAEEKTRIARELHDVVAHSMSIIAVQASSAAYRHPDVSAAVAQEFEEIAHGARTAMNELRGVLGVLRQGDATPDLGPQPTIADVPALVETTARSGVQITLDFDSSLTRDSVADGVGLAVYRTVQEGISNAVRHAPGAAIRVSCVVVGEAIALSVTNSRSLDAPAPSVGGLGLLGMRERLRAVGAALEVGPSPDGGFSVVARMPMRSTA